MVGTSPNRLPRRSLLTFFALVFALSVPFWVIGGVTGWQLIPSLPVSALMAVCPLIAAAILAFRKGKLAGVIGLLQRAFEPIRPAIWSAPVVLLVPAVMVLAYGVMRVLSWPLPVPQLSIATAGILFLIFLLPAACEELGWTGYAIDPLQNRLGWLQAALLVGVVESAWHLVPLLQAERTPSWIAGWWLSSIASRVLLVWLYNRAGRSTLAAILWHDVSNVSWLMFPNGGSHYDPRIHGPILAGLAAVVALTCNRQRSERGTVSKVQPGPGGLGGSGGS